ncbi:MAG: putative CoA-binding protein [Planctomycetota bacterium]|jgi:predicted CoA-binding protein
MDVQANIDEFLVGQVFAVVGASTNRSKYGNKVLRCYLQNDLIAWPVHPSEVEIEGVPCVSDFDSLVESVHGLSIVTPPLVTESVVEAAAEAGIKRLWMQPGAESNKAISRAKELGMTVIAGGPCILVALGFKE